ncbi:MULTISPECIES: TIGR04206 family protein [Haloprofundus]|uniref:TIGR04206 family protein n=1 Tax=Haloprofundus TaxID=1911573 RepID=UPI000E443B9B|nr:MULTISPECIES: TIGR04206 family protein [Haloprofundus]QCJ47720.1 TIGR04206 family protein [Haloprofundus sp. MHR1]
MAATTDGRDPRRTSTPRTLLFLLSLWLVPWSVLLVDGRPATLVFPWGLFDPGSGRLVSLYSYLFEFTGGFGSLPRYLRAWPTSVVAFLLATASAGGGALVGREDSRVTALLLVLAGLGQLSFAWGFAQSGGRLALPVGTVALWAAAWLYYR